MNKKETTKKDAAENNSLMRKTKTQLVELILRKDSVERTLREDIKSKEKELENKKRSLSIISNNYASLQNEYHSICDDLTSIECERNTTIKKQKVVICILAIIFCISVALNYIFYII